MLDPAKYSAIETLPDGRRVEIRALRPDDQADFIAAVGHTSAKSLYRRFFVPRRSFTEEEIAFFVHVDFIDHVAIIAVTEEGGRPAIVGGGRYIVVQPGQAELAFVVVDRYQGQGTGSALMRHLATMAREAGLTQLIAEVLPDNVPMLSVFKKAGFQLTGRGRGVVYLTLRLS